MSLIGEQELRVYCRDTTVLIPLRETVVRRAFSPNLDEGSPRTNSVFPKIRLRENSRIGGNFQAQVAGNGRQMAFYKYLSYEAVGARYSFLIVRATVISRRRLQPGCEASPPS